MSTPTTPTTPLPPAFEGLTSKRLLALGKSLVKLRTAYTIENKLEKAFGDWAVGIRGLWHLVRHDAVDCDENLQLLVVLHDDIKRNPAVTEDRLEALEHLLRGITSTRPENYPSYMASVPVLLVQLADYLYDHAPERARALYPVTQPNVQCTLALLMAFRGETLGSEAAEQLTTALVSSIGGAPPRDPRFDVCRLVEQLGTVDMFLRGACDVLADADRGLISPQGLQIPMRLAPPEIVVRSLKSYLRNNGQPGQWTEIRRALGQRDDLEAVARAIESIEPDPMQGDSLRLIVFPVFDTLPEGLEDQLLFSNLWIPELVDEYRQILRCMGERRATALARRALDESTMRASKRTWIPLLAIFGPSVAPLVREAVEQGLTEFIGLAPAQMLAPPT